MKFPTALKLAAAAIATGAMLVPGIAPAQAAESATRRTCRCSMRPPS